MDFNTNEPPLPSLDVITGGKKADPLSLRQAITFILFHADEPLYLNTEFNRLLTATTNNASVTGLKGGDTWKATFMLKEASQELGGFYSAIYENQDAKVRNMLTDVLRRNNAGRDRTAPQAAE